MSSAILFFISLGLCAWLVCEIRLASRFAVQGILINAAVCKRERISQGSRGRNLRFWVSFQTENGERELPLGYLSWWGFRDLRVGSALPIRFHPQIGFVIPSGRMGLIARPAIAGSLVIASSIISIAVTLASRP